MKCLLLSLLTTAVFCYGQPVEGPWVVMETTDSIQSLNSSMIALVDQATARLFFAADSSGQMTVWTALYGIEEHVFVDSAAVIRTDSVYNNLKDAMADSTDGWALIFDRQWSSSGRNTMAVVGDSSSHFEYLVGITRPWNQYIGGESASRVDLAPRVGGGWIMTWVQTHISTIYYEPESQVFVAGLMTDSVLYRQPLIPYDCQLFGPYSAAGISIASDTSFVLTQASWCWDLQGFGSALMRAVAGADSTVFDTLCRFNCDVNPMDIEPDSQGGFFAYSAESWFRNSLFSLDESGSCEYLGALDPAYEPMHLAYHPIYGYAGIWWNPSWIKVSRMNLDGSGAEPGVFYWRDNEHVIRSAALTITDDGRIHVVWTEGPAGTSPESRLMTGWINWDTPLSTSPQPEVVGSPSDFGLTAYPNPFNPTTTISFELPREGQVTLEVYDLMGRLVQELIHASMAAGAHHVTFDASQLPSGIYWSRLQVGGTQVVRKMVLLR